VALAGVYIKFNDAMKGFDQEAGRVFMELGNQT
jgi:hypothetical protein